MKKIIFLISTVFISGISLSQNAYYDAQFLSRIEIKDLNKILKSSDEINLSSNEILVINEYKSFFVNPFNNTLINLDINALKSSINKYNYYVEFQYKKEIADRQGGTGSSDFAPALLALIPSIVSGNFSLSSEQQTKIIDGLTKYYAEEFRKAQLLTYMQTFKKTIGSSSELQILFPQTYSKLENADPSKFPELGDEYKSIFNEDLKFILENFFDHVEDYKESNPKSDFDKNLTWLDATKIKGIKSNPYYGCIKITADIGSKLTNNCHPVDLFNYIDNKNYYSVDNYDKLNAKSKLLEVQNPNISQKVILILHGLNLIQRNLLDTSKSNGDQANIWLNLEDFKKLDTKNEWLYFSGILYQQDKAFFNKFIWDAKDKSKIKIDDLTFFTESERFEMQEKVNRVLSALVEIQNFRVTLKSGDIQDNFIEYMNLVLKTIESTNYFNQTDLPITDFQKYLQVSKYTLNIYDNARNKNFGTTIHYTIKILNELLKEDPNYIITLDHIEKYGTFMSGVINTKNSEEVKALIKKHAAPPTSFILKREYIFTLSVTGQPGYFLSLEKFDGKKENFGFVSGITLPIGFEGTFKTKKGKENSSSVGLFIQAIDLGAVLNFRVSDSISTLPDKIEFKQIFSPGISLTYGIKNSALVIGLGYQYAPQLRKVSLDNGNQIYPNGHRMFLRFAWDIPLINIKKSTSK